MSSCSNPKQEEETTLSTAPIQAETTEEQTEILGGLALSGEWGDASWELYHSGELVFKSSGELDSANKDEEPEWMLYSEYIKTLIISEGITEIGDYLFSSMESLEKVSLPDGLSKIGEYSFAGCSKLKEISLPDSVISVEDYAFENSGLEKIKLGSGVSSLTPLSFSGCKVTDIQVSERSASFSTDKYGVLFSKDKTELIWYSCGFLMNSYTVPDGVTSIGQNAFSNEYLTEIILPEGLIEIGRNAFRGCTGIKGVEIPSTVTEIGSGAFYGCRSIKEFTFPDGLTHISSEVLADCENLKTVNIPVSVLSIGESAFGSQATFEINYDGSKEAWKLISIADNNAAVNYAAKNYGL